MIIIAGLGRCGTTIMYESVKKFDNGLDNGFIRNLDKLNVYPFVLKTHDIAPLYLPEGTKVIYMFGDPISTVLSFHNEEKVNIEKSYYNLNTSYNKLGKQFDEDIFNLEQSFDSWYKEQSFELMTLRYETMWDNIKQINEFIQLNLEFPIKKNRTNLIENISTYDKLKLDQTYKSISKKIIDAQDIKIWNITHKQDKINGF